MAKRCKTFDHTADIGLAATADTLGELFEAMAEGLAELICPIAQVEPRQKRQIRAEAEDIEALAVDFLSQVMVTIETERFAIAAVAVEEIDHTHVRARIVGEPLDPARHELDTEVKAVTYHQLSVVCDAGRWMARVILDV